MSTSGFLEMLRVVKSELTPCKASDGQTAAFDAVIACTNFGQPCLHSPPAKLSDDAKTTKLSAARQVPKSPASLSFQDEFDQHLIHHIVMITVCIPIF